MSSLGGQGVGKAAQRAVSKGLDWSKIDSSIYSDEGRRELERLKRVYEEMQEKFQAKFNLKPSIDWEKYKKELGPSIVNIFQKSYEAIELPEVEEELPEITEFKKMNDDFVAEAEKIRDDYKKYAQKMSKEIEKVEEEKGKLRTMSVDEYFAKHPEVKEEIDKEIKEQNWWF